ncbi:DUF63 family protein [Halovenus sp. WSH3]|uniref:DUF63 family protein n=1 Tax=Halovenus carboxidivorans TaxID=2692199 RepID=A0A6B0T046_9EURY|nr:DUF63 family protein [Halovenus carboxidivorans]MXR50607.1 DUF63 family protein [Halovenus carboxidivorans]
MAAPFSEFVVPGPIQSAALVIGAGTIVVLLYALRPPLTQRTVLSFIPWMISGSILHVFWQLGYMLQRQLYPEPVAPLFSAPAVYLTTFIALGAVWVVSATIVPSYDRSDRIATYIFTIGVGVLLPLLGLVLWQGLDERLAPMDPIWPVLGLVLSLVLTVLIYIAIGAWRTYVIAQTKYVGAFVLFAHVFDGVTTAIGVDVLGAGERSAVPAAILEFAAGLPVADTLGTGWLFVLVKITLASAIVVTFADYVEDEPSQANLLLTIIAIVGMGPAVNNFFLFLLSP